jgi:glucokinase-like ROK family protein
MSTTTTAIRSDPVDDLVTLLDLVRRGVARTRPELVRASGIGRNIVSERVGLLLQAGLLREPGLAASTGGRAARELTFAVDAGHVLVAAIGASNVQVALTDLAGTILARRRQPAEVTDGPVTILAVVDALYADLIRENNVQLWGIGVGVPGPVEFSTGRPVAPPIMPGWDGYDIRGRFVNRYAVPVWVDNDVNIMALGELRTGAARGHCDAVFVKVGSGIGAGLVSHGRIHRGADGSAGDIGHMAAAADPADSAVVCRCGNRGCLEALAGGAAIVRDAIQAAHDGHSPILANLLTSTPALHAIDIVHAAQHGDQTSRDLLQRSAHLVGEALAGIVNFFNPRLIVLDGQVTGAGDTYLAQVRQTVLGRSLPLATRSLQITTSPLHGTAGLIGAAYMVTDELFSHDHLPTWIHHHPRAMIAFSPQSA